MTFTAAETTDPLRSAGPSHPHPALHRRRVRRFGGRGNLRRPRPGVQHQLRHRRRRPEGRHRPRRRRGPRGVHQRPVAEDEAARAGPRPEQDRRRRRSPGGPPGRARNLRHRPADHPGHGPGAARGRELPLLRRPDRGPVRRRHEGPRRPDQLRQPQADRRRRAHHAVEHPVHARVLEARPGPRHRQHRGAQAGRVHPAVGLAVGRRSSRTPGCPTASSTWSTASARKPATPWSSTRTCR